MLRLACLLMLLLPMMPVLAADPVPKAPQSGVSGTLSEADHDALRGLLVDATAALNRLDTSTLAQYLADGFVLTFADQHVVTDLGQLDSYVRNYFEGSDAPLKAVHFAPQATELTRAIDGRTGLVYGTSTDTYTLADGTSLSLDTHWTATVVRQDGGWRLQGFHAGVNMLDNAIINAVQRRILVWAAVALAVGLVMGTVIAPLLRRH